MDSDDENFKLPFSSCPPDVGGVDLWDAEGLLSPYMPTTQEKLDYILSNVTFTPDDVLYDLGCGDGRALFTAVALGCPKATGVDMDAPLISSVNEQITAKGLQHCITARVQDMLQVDLSDATVLYLYLLPKALEALQPKVQAMMESGKLRVVFATLFDFPSLQFNKRFDPTHRFYTYSQ